MDVLPQTHHVECVAVLTREDRGAVDLRERVE